MNFKGTCFNVKREINKEYHDYSAIKKDFKVHAQCKTAGNQLTSFKITRPCKNLNAGTQ
jgi:hypothetical protein